jgi:hypothetical protein
MPRKLLNQLYALSCRASIPNTGMRTVFTIFPLMCCKMTIRLSQVFGLRKLYMRASQIGHRFLHVPIADSLSAVQFHVAN